MARPMLLVVAMAGAAAAGAGVPVDVPFFVPEALAGFAVQPLAVTPAATALAFGPGSGLGEEGPDLYATLLTGQVLRVSLTWALDTPVAGMGIHAEGFSSPLGLVFDGDVLYVADSHPGEESGRTDGRITRVDPDGTRTVVVDGLPNGRHNTNHLRFGPDGRLYMANGNPNDNGLQGGDADVFPYSGAILSVDAAQVSASPAVLHWLDEQGAAIPEEDIAAHPRNADFAAKVHVLAWGFRNVYGIAFSPQGIGYTAMNGADDPASQDTLHRITPGTDYGFPFCYNEGPPGGVGADVVVVPNPVYGDAARCEGVEPATALLGWHTCATGLDFPTEGPFAFPEAMRDDVFVAECATFWGDDLTPLTMPVTHNTSHKVVRVLLDEQGHATEVQDFLFGLVLPTDALFGPDGALYVGDIEAVYRVIPVV